MGGKWALGLMLLFLLMGCLGSKGDGDSTPPIVQIEREVVKECPPNPAISELLSLKDQCFASLNEREETITKLRQEIMMLREQVAGLRSEADEWRREYRNEQNRFASECF